MSKLITAENKPRMKRSARSGNLVAVFEVEGVTYRSATGCKSEPGNYDKKFYVATDEDGEMIVNDFTTPNGTVQKMVPFEGFEGITRRELVTHAAEVKWTGTIELD